jgi:RNA polymerase sigma factor (TIGR02999 family)
MRLVDQSQIDWRGRAHFYAMAAKTLRRILVDHARARGAAKREAVGERITLTGSIAEVEENQLDLMQLDEALERLRQLSPRQADLVELRFFGGLSIRETAEALGIAEPTVKWTWRMARAWLLRELGDERDKRPE